MCVEAYRQEAETQRRHINSAFMTFVVLDKDDQPQKLPWIRPQPGVSALSQIRVSCVTQGFLLRTRSACQNWNIHGV